LYAFVKRTRISQKIINISGRMAGIKSIIVPRKEAGNTYCPDTPRSNPSRASRRKYVSGQAMPPGTLPERHRGRPGQQPYEAGANMND
jgi:hypothetical protein